MEMRVLLLCAMTILLAGCPKPQTASCQSTPHSVSTRVAIATIGTPSRQFEVTARGFTPNAQARLGVHQFPKRDDFTVDVTFDASGSLRWNTDAPLLLTTDPAYDPEVDVQTTLFEPASHCTAATSIKESEFARID
jgi:hypothetical protein